LKTIGLMGDGRTRDDVAGPRAVARPTVPPESAGRASLPITLKKWDRRGPYQTARSVEQIMAVSG
jgi:hypothetical protein